MRHGVCVPQAGRFLDPAVQQRLATEVEALGYDSIWVSDHVIVPVGESYIPEVMHEPLALLAWLGAVTERVDLGVSVLVVPYRDPVFTAKFLSSSATAGTRSTSLPTSSATASPPTARSASASGGRRGR